MKKLAVLTLTFSLTASLLACSKDDNSETAKKVEEETKNEKIEIVKEIEASDLFSNLEDISTETGKKVFVYEVVNDSDNTLEVPFEKDGGFGYVVRNEKGEEIDDITYTKDIVANRVLAPGEFLTTRITFFGLPVGNYELEVWLESSLDENYAKTIEFEMKR
ncbi:BsuPI-related putative proteinase inhibitor [Fredinandcohnia sp. 179-A 10B2 NHS]|uniref:BsuPI-related putative proteinase inhibitor n=1 Tax=Fredinandcohnia sp. 179-A 10B2 NHS TaxID=3235176 RepID=UPI0039A0E173